MTESKAAIEQEAADLAHDSGAMIDRALPGTMKRLNVLLLDALLRYERNMRLTRGGAGRFGIIAIILLALDEWLHILRADDPDLVTECFEPTRPIEGAGASLDNDGAVINLRDHRKQLVTHDPTLEDHTAISIYTVELENIFGDVDAEDVDRHD